jgi:aspartate racemase
MTVMQREAWGILGGMGPLASAEFIKSIYEHAAGLNEQDHPKVILLSDPAVEDRTCGLLAGRDEAILDSLRRNISTLRSIGLRNIVVCCVTVHQLIQRLPPSWQADIVSLLDTICDAIQKSRQPHLLLCTTGTRKLRLFETHKMWPSIVDRVVLPIEEDQNRIHGIIYQRKANDNNAAHIMLIEELLAKYSVESYIAACTELHIVAKHHERTTGRDRRELCIDPLTAILPLITHHADPLPADRQMVVANGERCEHNR